MYVLTVLTYMNMLICNQTVEAVWGMQVSGVMLADNFYPL